jgi:hypothetical protein
VDFLTFDLGSVADSIDIENPAKSLAYPLSHIRDQFSREAVYRSRFPLIVAPLDAHHVALDFDIDVRRQGGLQLTFWAFQTNAIRIHGDLDTVRNRYRQLSNSRH